MKFEHDAVTAAAKKLLKLPLIALDCVGNLLVGGSWRNTLSSEAWKHREHSRWGWTHQAIDAFFGKNHCQEQAADEDRYGSVWAAWWASVKGA